MKNKVETYIDSFPEDVKERLVAMRQIIQELAPDADEQISYGIVGYKIAGRPLVYIGGFKNHVSLFAAGSQMVAEKFNKELEGYIQSKGTIQFSLKEPLPTELIRGVVKARIEESAQKK